MPSTDILACWGDLQQGGLLLSPAALATLLEQPLPPWPPRRASNLHAAITQFIEADKPSRKQASHLLDLVLEDALGYSHGWLKPSAIGTDWALASPDGEIKPQRLWKGRSGGLLPVFQAEPHVQLGLGRGRHLGVRVVEWLRRQRAAIALLTNGTQWRLIHAGSNHEAYVEWHAGAFFDSGSPSLQLQGMRQVLGIQALQPETSESEGTLSAALKASRKAADLSQQMGERVRQAVEALISAQSPALDAIREDVPPRVIYVAACRIIMRLIILLFAEARGLLPRDNPIYRESYGLSGLPERLNHASAKAPIGFSAWPQLLGAFQLIYWGSHHRELVVPTYGGEFFEAGDATSRDPLSRALAALECPEGVSDPVVGKILDLLCRTHVRIQVGRQRSRMTVPVDFSDLSSAYIGIVYEGLLDFELRRAADAPILFLNLGKQPAMPLNQLEGLDDKALKSLLDGLRTRGDENDDDTPDLESPEPETDNPAMSHPETGNPETGNPETDGPLTVIYAEPAARDARRRSHDWARRALEVGRLLGARDMQDPAKREQATKALIKRIVLPGEWYLVRWGGTRKGSGTFYTRPELTLPMVKRTLHALIHESPNDGQSPDALPADGAGAGRASTDGASGGGSGDGGAREDELAIDRSSLKLPEALLRLKICDPSMGSGSFLVAALRYLTEALLQSLYAHGRIQVHGRHTVVTLASGLPSNGELCEETLPLPPEDPNFESALRARLKRHLVERCLYGVDLDPLAVELGKLALWVETMDRDLPFSFLDHKLKVGNALVGAHFDTFLRYPAMAWEREGGDKGHRGVHFENEAWSGAIKTRRGRIRSELEQLRTGSLNWLNEDRSSMAIATHAQALTTMEKLHDLPVHRADLRAKLYREEILESSALGELKRAFDTWCALWFWPADRLDIAPTPLNYLNPEPETLALIDQLAESRRFFHWELEFPDVFTAPGSGFDAQIGNPPWETPKPNSREFFAHHDARYRTYGKQEALRQQQAYFQADVALERSWLEANAMLKALSNWGRYAGDPFGAPRGESPPRSTGPQPVTPLGYADPEHPFRHQGGADPNTYKMFLELAHSLLKTGGRMGMIVPAGLYSDKGAQALRELFIERCRWNWLFAFENRQKIFDIDSRFKFCMVVLSKGGRTETLRAAFMRQDSVDWERAEQVAFAYETAQVERFSPKSKAFFELEGKRDVALLRTIYANAVLLGDKDEAGWGIQSSSEFHMTGDSAKFSPRPDWEAKGYRPDAYGRWIGPLGEIALPFYQGVMIHQFDDSAKEWIRGTGLSALWDSLPWEAKRLAPQFLMAFDQAVRKGDRILAPKVTYRTIARNTDERTLIASLNAGLPCGHKLGVLRMADMMLTCALPALLNSFVLDWVARIRISGTQVDAHIMAELPLVDPRHELLPHLALNTLRLNGASSRFAQLWLALRPRMSDGHGWTERFCLTPHERLRVRCITEALVAAMYGLSLADLKLVLAPDPKNPRGFWRVDKDKPPELRLTTLVLEAFRDLLARGPRAFLAQHDGEGWRLPETLMIAGRPRPVRSALGPRLLPWQDGKNAVADWKACQDHAGAFMARTTLPANLRASGTMAELKQPALF